MKQTGKKIVAVLVLALLIGWMVEKCEEKPGRIVNNEILRNEPGMGEGVKELVYQIEGEKTSYPIQLSYKERKWNYSEWCQQLEEARKEVETLFLAENTNAEHVSGKVNLCETVADGMIKVSWAFEPEDWVDVQGNIIEENLKDGELVMVSATLSYEQYESVYEFPIRLYQKPKSKEQMRELEIQAYADAQDETGVSIRLPDTLQGKKIRWETKKSHTMAAFFLLGIVLSVGILLGEKYETIRKKRSRNKELAMDYPEIVSQLGLLLEAGMSLQQAWKKMITTYERKQKHHQMRRREGYEEMRITMHELQDGIGEMKAFERFGERCVLAQYRRLASVLTQTMKKGTVGIGRILSQEAESAFVERKNVAHRIGEEAGTKMLFPMLLMLVIIMMILVVPACMTMNI